MTKETRAKRNKIKMRIGYWEAKSGMNPKFLDRAETEILKLKNELIKLIDDNKLI